MDDSDKTATAEKQVFQLFVSGMSANSMQAITNINSLFNKYIPKLYELEIIDIYKNPECALPNQIVFSPSLVRQSPLPKVTLIGTFSDTEKVIKSLGFI